MLSYDLMLKRDDPSFNSLYDGSTIQFSIANVEFCINANCPRYTLVNASFSFFVIR